MILVVKHIDIEGPGTLGEFLQSRGRAFKTVELGAGERLPSDVNGLEAVIVLGGPMNVDEEDIYPFLKEENAFIQKVLKAGIPYLGICLGSQLLAKAAGAQVTQSPVKEIGWFTVSLTRDGQADPLFAGFDPAVPIYHWHGDMFGIPSGGTLLATAVGCPHQALRVGANAYGVQFHVEITDVSIREWADEYCRKSPERLSLRKEMLDGYARHRTAFDRQAARMYENFLKIVDSYRKEAVKTR